MPLLNSLATPYAQALLQVTDARKESDDVADQCKQLLSIWSTSSDFREAMTSPVLEPDAKKQVLSTLLSEQIQPSLLNLLKVLADRQRLVAFDAVLNRYLDLYRQSRQISLAKVATAQALSETQQAALTQKVQAMLGKGSVEMDLSVDPSLIGGFVVNLGSQVIDASLAGQVRRLGLALAKTS
ncbi:ATP synthase F1 subunit delta [Synechococcus sp. UW140]|uniref:ATP synthase F1 subunit delta n=1 Tax=Synechococcus sp. UW140 TaxID=368503 RepID=UPI000B624049|nr:ATP synthase F1 subunit delta [Synechococcus sp. UW140]OUW46654.1 MAG: ATP F0F1 synthase subunit delta [Synechococcus sp. TMED187]